jgi:hypothetical protein
MNNQDDAKFCKEIELTQSLWYWVISNLWKLILVFVLFFGADIFLKNFDFNPNSSAPIFQIISDFNFSKLITAIVMLISLFLVLHAFWKLVELCFRKYIITRDRILIHEGVFFRTNEQMELYKAYDYSNQQNLLELIFGLMTIKIISRDISDPVLKITGIKNDHELISVIRMRAEKSKEAHPVFEINANPMVEVKK